MSNGRTFLRSFLFCAVLLFIFSVYTNGLARNPPGFYVDECGIAYNAYLLGNTGAGEFGGRLPLFFQFYTDGWTQWANPTQIYLLAIPFRILGPGILVARIFSAFWVFAACILLGLLAKQISRRTTVGIIVGGAALLTPWLFEVGRLVFETYFYPMALVLFLLAAFRAHTKERWTIIDIAAVAITLSLLTYSYTIGRLVGPLMAFGLLLFVNTPEKWFSVLKTWAAYAVTLAPLAIFRLRHPTALTQRFYTISYIGPNTPWRTIASTFVRRYLEDLSIISLLIDGDANPRHHVPGALGSFLIGIFILAAIGVLVVIVQRWREPWWRFILFGTFASVIPGSLTVDQFHSLRMIAYPIFLLILTVPALELMLSSQDNVPKIVLLDVSLHARQLTLAVLLLAAVAQTLYFQKVFRRDGPEREAAFDVDYKTIYEAALAQPQRPIYLLDGEYGPVDACGHWYATLDHRDAAEFVHLSFGETAPTGTVVISSQEYCVNCEVIARQGYYVAYRQF